jgi:IS5 family transposase
MLTLATCAMICNCHSLYAIAQWGREHQKLAPKLSLAMDPELAQIDRLLEDELLLQRVKADLLKRYPNTPTLGRHSTPVEVLLRMLVAKRLYHWSYEETEHFVADSLVLRQFCRLYLEPAPGRYHLHSLGGPHRPPDPGTTQPAGGGLGPLALGSTMASGCSVVYSGGPRLSWARRSANCFGTAAGAPNAWPTRSVRPLGDIGEAAQAMYQSRYQRLLAVAQASLRQAERVREGLAAAGSSTSQGLLRALNHFRLLVQQVLAQARRRVLAGGGVPSSCKLPYFAPKTS